MSATYEKYVEVNLQESPIQCTYNYARFKFLPNNRPINKLHLKRLIEGMRCKNLLHSYPILVTADDYVHDGQHRLLAARANKLPVFFRVIKNLPIEDIITAAMNSEKWNMNDFLHFHISHGKASYVRLQRILDTHPNISLPLALRVLCDHKEAQQRFKKGEMELESEELLVNVLNKMDRTLAFLKEKMIKDKHILRTQVLMCGLSMFFKNPNVELDKFLYKLEVNLEKLHQCVHYKGYVDQFMNIYNFATKKKERIK